MATSHVHAASGSIGLVGRIGAALDDSPNGPNDPTLAAAASSANGDKTNQNDVSSSNNAVNRSDSRSADSSPRSANGMPNFVRWQALENLLLDGDGVQLFRSFLEVEANGHLLDFYFATDGFPKLFDKKDAGTLRQLAKQICKAFLRGNRSVRLRPETRAALGDHLRDEPLARNMFDTAKSETIEYLRSAHRAFLVSDVFLNFIRDGGAGGSQRDGTSTSDSDSHSCCSAASGCGSSECLSQIASGTASAGANQSQSGSVRASAYLPSLPEDVDELINGSANSNANNGFNQDEQLLEKSDEADSEQFQDLLDSESISRTANGQPSSTQTTHMQLQRTATVTESQAQISQTQQNVSTAQPFVVQRGTSRTDPPCTLPYLGVGVHSEQTAAPPFDGIGIGVGVVAATSSTSASQSSALKLNKENLRKTQLSRAAELPSAVFGPTHPAYITASTNATFSSRKPPNPYYTAYATVSTQDSELQSQSSDALNDDGSSLLNENNVDSQAHKRHKYQQRHFRRMQQNRDNLQVLHVVPAPPAQLDATERELSTKQPAVFAQRLISRLQAVIDDQIKSERMSSIMNDPNNPANLTANLQKDDATLLFASLSLSSGRNALSQSASGQNVAASASRTHNSDAISRLASLTNRFAVDPEHQDAQSILEEHCSRVWEKSNELTPIRAASPPIGQLHGNARSGSSRQSSRAYPTSIARASQQAAGGPNFQTLPFNAPFQQVSYQGFPQQQQNATTYQHPSNAALRGPPTSLTTSSYESRDDAAAYGVYSRYQPATHGQQSGLYGAVGQAQQSVAGPYSVSSYPAGGYYHGPGSKSDTGCSDLSDAIVLTGPASGVHGGPLRPLSESASTGSVVAISNITCTSGSASSGIVSDYSLATTASGASRSHRKNNSQSQPNASGRLANSDKQQYASSASYASSKRVGGQQTTNANASFATSSSGLQQFVAQQSLNCRSDMPRQPFMSNPMMPPVPQPNTDTQIAEAARRLANAASRCDSNDERSQTSSLPRSQPQSISASNTAQAAGGASNTQPNGEGTQVIYYLPNEKVPYRSTLPLRNVTLAQFRSTVISKRDVLRFFFKKTCDDVEAGVVFEEITTDDTVLPLFEGKIVARLERAE